jgi:hypothetical protein
MSSLKIPRCSRSLPASSADLVPIKPRSLPKKSFAIQLGSLAKSFENMRQSRRMKNLFNHCNGGIQGRIPCLTPVSLTPIKFLLVIGLLAAGLQSSRADVLQSPRGMELFGEATPMVIVPPGQKVRLMWDFPVNRETPDLVFKVYHSVALRPSFRNWNLLTNVPGTFRSVDLPATQGTEFFVMTASNYLGESSFATR